MAATDSYFAEKSKHDFDAITYVELCRYSVKVVSEILWTVPKISKQTSDSIFWSSR